MTKIKIENFQSIGSVEFSIDGFTTIVGKNNIGKSAVVRAVKAALTNQSGKEYIRNGEKKTDVHIEHGNLKISWSKGESSSYKINGSSYSSLNRAVPEDILKAGFRNLEVGDLKLNPLMASQFEPLFLINETGSVITDAIATLYHLDVLNNADDLCQKDLRSKKSLTKTRDKDLNKVAERLEVFKDFPGIKQEVGQIQELKSNCDKNLGKVSEIGLFISLLSETADKVKKLKAIDTLKVPDYKPLEQIEKTGVWVNSILKSCEESALVISKLNTAVIVSIPETTGLQVTVKKLSEATNYLGQVREMAYSLKKQRDAFEAISNQMQTASPKASLLVETVKKLEYVCFASTSLEGLIGGTKEYEIQLENLKTKIEQAGKEMSAYNSCPLCKRPL